MPNKYESIIKTQYRFKFISFKKEFQINIVCMSWHRDAGWN